MSRYEMTEFEWCVLPGRYEPAHDVLQPLPALDQGRGLGSDHGRDYRRDGNDGEHERLMYRTTILPQLERAVPY